MFGSGDRRPNQTMRSWFPSWPAQAIQPAPRPTQTTHQRSTQPPPQQPPATARPSPSTGMPTSRPPAPTASQPLSRSQLPAPPTSQKQIPTIPSFQAPPATRPAAPAQPQRQQPLKPTPQPQPMKNPSTPEPQHQPQSASQVEPSTPVDQKPKRQPSPSKSPTTVPAEPKPQPVSTVPSTMQTKAKPQTTQPASTKTTAATQTEPKPQPTSKTPAISATQAETIRKPTRDHVTTETAHSAAKPPTQIPDVRPPAVASKPEQPNHVEEPQPIGKISDVPRSETKVEIIASTSKVDTQTTKFKEKSEKMEMTGSKSVDSLQDPASLNKQQLSEEKTAMQREKQKETTTCDRRANPPSPRRGALGLSDARDQETKTTIHVRQKDKNLESEVYQREKVPQNDHGLRKDIKEGVSRLFDKLGDGQQPQLGEDPDVRVITLAGENKGAHMDISHGTKRKDGTMHIYRGYKLGQEDKTEQSSDEEESQKVLQDTKKPFTAYINNNTQSINNSIMYHSSCNSHNPGVYLSITNNTAEPIRQQRRIVPVEVSSTQARKLSTEPTVRRRCLRSLFLESSESDPENPEKPRHHGCRYECQVQKTETPAAVAGASRSANNHK